MAEQHVAIFQGLGLSPEQIAEIEGVTPEKLTEFKADGYLTAINGVQKTKFSNDADFLGSLSVDKLPATLTKNIESGTYGRFMNELKELAAKEWGVDPKTVLSPDQEKSLKGAFKTLRDASIKDKPEAMKELQAQLATALQDKEATATTLKKEMEVALATEKGATGAILERIAGVNVIASVKGLTTPAKFLVSPVLQQVKAKYAMVVDPETFDVKLMQKANPELEALDGGGKPLSYSAIVAEILKKEGVIDETKAAKEGAAPVVTTVTVGENGSVVPSYIADKMKATLEEEKKAKKE